MPEPVPETEVSAGDAAPMISIPTELFEKMELPRATPPLPYATPTSLKAIVLPVPGVVPPTTFPLLGPPPPKGSPNSTPSSAFPSGLTPSRATPILLPCKALSTEPSPKSIPARLLPEMTLAEPGTVPPIVLFGART